MSLHNRIREARKQIGLTQEELGKRIGVAKTTVAGYEKNREPTAAQLGAIADVLGVDVTFLLQDEIRIKREVTASPHEMENLVKKYRLLDSHGKEMVDLVLDKETERMELEAKARKEREAMEAGAIAEKGSDNVMPFRKSIQSCSAGTGVYLGPEEFEIIYVAENELTLRGDFAVPVSGNSMEPTYHDSDILIIEATEDIPVGKIGLFTMDGEGYVKERGENTLLSLNPQYDPIPMREGIRCNGLVIGILDPQWIK